MKIIKVDTDNKTEVLDFPEGTIMEELEALRTMVGPECRLVEHVRPMKLYTVFGAPSNPNRTKSSAVSMLVDEEGILSGLPLNHLGSWLYGTEEHGHPIVGNVLFVGEYDTGDGYSFCGLSDEMLNKLLPQIKGVADMINTFIISEGGGTE